MLNWVGNSKSSTRCTMVNCWLLVLSMNTLSDRPSPENFMVGPMFFSVMPK